MDILKNIAKYVIAYFFEKFRYVMKQSIDSESPV